MDWYYQYEDEKTGPVSRDGLDELFSQGKINNDTHVSSDSAPEGLTYGELTSKQADETSDTEVTVSTDESCAECGRPFPADEMIKYEEKKICASCKPVFFQKIREGVSTESRTYGGFWIRFGAKFIDGIITGIVTYTIAFLGGMGLGSNPETLSAGMGIIIFLQYAIPFGYTTFFIGKYAATPGKMACGLKVISPDGESISYLRAAGRTLAEYLSGIILAIGYIMAAFDDEKRTLHDRICSTRVIKKK